MKKRILFTRCSNRGFTHSLLAACLLAGSAVATTADATVTILATGQPFAENILVDGSRVYWIRHDSGVLSVDKVNGGLVRTHSAGGAGLEGGDIVKDTAFLYFVRNETDDSFSVNKVAKTSSSPVQLTDEAIGLGLALHPVQGILFYTTFKNVSPPGHDPMFDTVIEKISTLGGAPSDVIPLPITGLLPISVLHFSTDNVYLHWSQEDPNDSGNNGIFRIPLVGGAISTDVSGTAAEVLSTPITDPAGGYLFWTEDSNSPNVAGVLKRQDPGGHVITLVSNVGPTLFTCFAAVGSFVYCERGGAIVKVSIDGGTPVEVVSTTDANYPVGLASDGTYLFWTAAGDGSIRRIAIPPTTSAATKVAAYSATLNGSVNPGGLTTSVYFQYGATASYGSSTPIQTQTGNTFRNVSANISSLMANHVYHFRVVASNTGGTRYGSDRTFTTLSATGPPVVTTNPATLIASFSATLNGSLDPHGLTTNVYFQYGTTTSYGLTTAAQSHTGNTYLNISANISGLLASHIYHFRIVATNSAGTRYGSDRTFTTLTATGAAVVTTNSATNVTSSSATLNGSLDPHGLTTNVYFQYGTTTSYGHTTPMQSQTGNAYRNITRNISGLSTHTTYHFRMVATNSAGTRFGGDRSFTTP